MIDVFKWIESPIGRLRLVGNDAGLLAVLWENDGRKWKHLQGPQVESPDHPVLVEAERQLAEYFAGQRQSFTIRLDLQGTAFQQAVWQAMLAIPFGQSRSYGEIARQIGRPTAMRAVGAAAGMNPIAIIAPCHRVLGKSGTLTGFAGGLQAKAGLLAVENIKHRPSPRGRVALIDQPLVRQGALDLACPA